ncbi:MAG TPA: TPM domain-containing protein [Candidatus Angelobacter sp.]|nr:TPM domain-containing protein [Candidatus Angelobacter sp.]
MPNYLNQARYLLICLVIACIGLTAQQAARLKPSGFVNDFASVIDTESAREMQYLCEQVNQRAQAQIAVVTVNTLDGLAIESYARRLFRQWGIGPKSNNRGILILLAVQDHKYRIEVGTGLEAVVTDRKAAGFGREAVPYLKAFQYGKALQVITRRVTDAIASDANITIADAPAPTPAYVSTYSNSSASNINAGGIVLALLVIVGICILLAAIAQGSGQGTRVFSPGYRSYGYGYPVYQNVGGYYNNSNTYFFSGFGGSNNSSSDSSSSSSSWGGGGGFGGGDSGGFGGGSSSCGGSSGDWSSSSSDSSSSSSSSSDFGGGSSDGGGASGSW